MIKKGVYKNCVICDIQLEGQQRKFCSQKCKNKNSSLNNASYIRQQKRGIKRKLNLVKLKGGCCEICGYKKNLTALTFHHINPDKKLFNVEMRNIANYNWNKVLKEADQCQLLCHNCHHELHHPEFNLKKLLTDNQN